MAQPANRVVFLNLAQIGMPVGAVTSILHRISGVLLAFAVPATAWLLARSLAGPEGYRAAADFLAMPAIKLGGIACTWALAHHLLAGIRHMLMDVDVGSRLASARRSAWTVNVLAVVIAILAVGAWW